MSLAGYSVPAGKGIVYLPLRDVVRWAGNAKDHDLGGLHQSFDEFGFRGAVEYDQTTGCLVAGHGRLETLEQRRDAGQDPPEGVYWTDVAGEYSGPRDYLVPVIDEPGFPNELKARKYVIASNQHTINGGWHGDVLVRELEEILAAGETLDGVGIDGDDLDRLKADLDNALGTEDEDDDDLPPPPPDDRPEELFDSEEGVRYDLGPHRVLWGLGTAAHWEALLGGTLDALYERERAPYAVLLAVRPGSGVSLDSLGKTLVAAEQAGHPAFFLVPDARTCDGVRQAWTNYQVGAGVAGEDA